MLLNFPKKIIFLLKLRYLRRVLSGHRALKNSNNLDKISKIKRILSSTQCIQKGYFDMRALELPKEKVFTNYQNVGNTVSASIPIALHDANTQGILNHGDKVMLVGFGVSYSWGG